MSIGDIYRKWNRIKDCPIKKVIYSINSNVLLTEFFKNVLHEKRIL